MQPTSITTDYLMLHGLYMCALVTTVSPAKRAESVWDAIWDDGLWNHVLHV